MHLILLHVIYLQNKKSIAFGIRNSNMEAKQGEKNVRRAKRSTLQGLTPVESQQLSLPSPHDEKKEKLKKMIQSTSQLHNQSVDVESARRRQKHELEQVKKELGSLLQSSSIPKVQFGEQFFQTCVRKKVPRTMISDVIEAVQTLYGKESARAVSEKLFELHKEKCGDSYEIRFKTHVSSKSLKKDEFFRIK